MHVNLDPSHISHACAVEVEPMAVKMCNTRHEDMVMENALVTIDSVQHISLNSGEVDCVPNENGEQS